MFVLRSIRMRVAEGVIMAGKGLGGLLLLLEDVGWVVSMRGGMGGA